MPAGLDAEDPEVVSIVRGAAAEVRADPHDALRWARLGMIYEANAITGAARRCYEQALVLNEGEPRWWYRLAMVRERLGDLDGAIAAARRAADSNGRYAPAHWRLGFWLLDRNDLDGAARAFEHATEIDPADPAGWLGRARVFLQGRQTDRALPILEKVLVERPSDRYALHLLGTAYRQFGRASDAELVLAAAGKGERVWRDSWTDALVEYRRGFGAVMKDAVDRFRAGDLATAARLLEGLRSRKPDDVTVLNQLGAVYVAAGRFDEAITTLKAALARDRDHFETHVNLASAYAGRGNLAQALEHVDRAIALDPEVARAHEKRGTILLQAGRDAPALQAFEAALRYDPRNLMALMASATIHYDAGRLRQALARFEQATRTDPAVAEAFVGMALVQMDLGALDRAEAAVHHAARLNPRHPHVQAALARLKARQLR